MSDYALFSAAFILLIALFCVRRRRFSQLLSARERTIPVLVCIVVLVAPALGRVVYRQFIPAFRTPHQRAYCINNLRQIDGAKEQWAIEHKIPAGEPAPRREVDQYIKGGRPRCPQGGYYIYGKVDETPKCTFPGHGLK